MSKYAVEVNNVTKTFHLPRHKNDSLKAAITQAFKPKEKGADDFHVLNGVSFKVEKGDFFGILGRNGSGKSTLLKIISEIYRPTSGSVKHDGKLVSFIELGVGFKAELSGRENVYLNGGLLGFSKQEVEEMYDDIVAFAELEDFMDQKLKNYSSGMKVRLAFSVAIRAKADILILDEVLAVGDADFQRKCTNYFETLKNDGKTVILVTHSMGNVRKFCNKAVVIEEGKLIHEGDPNEAADEYLRLFKTEEVVIEDKYVDRTFSKVEVGSNSTVDKVGIELTLEPAVSISDPVVIILIKNKGRAVFRWVSDEKEDHNSLTLIKNKVFQAKLQLQNIFPVGEYTIDVSVKSKDRAIMYCDYIGINTFSVTNSTQNKHDVLWHPNETFSWTEAS